VVVGPDGIARFADNGLPVIASRLVDVESGLAFPADVAEGSQPADSIHAYISATEVMGRRVTSSEFNSAIRSVKAGDLLINLAAVMKELELKGILEYEVQESFVRGWLQGPALTRVLALIRQQRPLFVPQVVMVAMKAALAMSPPGFDMKPLPASTITLIMLYLGDTLDAAVQGQSSWAGVAADIALDMARNQHFNRDRSIYSQVAAFLRIWEELPRELGHSPMPTDQVKAAIGINLVDLMVIGSLLRGLAELEGQLFVPPNAVEAIPLEADVRSRALALLTASEDELRSAITSEHSDNSVSWDFEAFRRKPVLRVPEGDLVVLSQRFLADATLGRAAFEVLDEAARLSDGGKRGRNWERFRNRHADSVEAYVRESVAGWAPPLAGQRRIWTEADQRRAWGKGVSVSDLLLDYGWCWVCLEVVSRRMSRGAIASGQLQDLDAELHMAVVAKARQLGAAVANLRRDEHALTGTDPFAGRRYFPLVVAAHGFPANAITLAEARSRSAQVLAGPGVAPLEVIDLEELDFIDAVLEVGPYSLPELLSRKHEGSFERTSMTEFLRGGLQINPPVSQRVYTIFGRARELMMARTGTPTNDLPSSRS